MLSTRPFTSSSSSPMEGTTKNRSSRSMPSDVSVERHDVYVEEHVVFFAESDVFGGADVELFAFECVSAAADRASASEDVVRGAAAKLKSFGARCPEGERS
jgi:hypothetical protein